MRMFERVNVTNENENKMNNKKHNGNLKMMRYEGEVLRV